MYCKNCGQPVDPNAAVCVNCGVANGSGQNYCANCGSPTTPGAAICVKCGFALNAQGAAFTGAQANAKSKTVAGILAILLGSLGIHNFYLGNTKKAVIQLVVTLVGSFAFGLGPIAMEIWGIVEGIQILTGKIATDANGVPLKD